MTMPLLTLTRSFGSLDCGATAAGGSVVMNEVPLLEPAVESVPG